MDKTQRFQPDEKIVYREEEDGAFLFDPDTGNLKYMNRSAKETYLMLSDQTEVDQVIDRLLGLFPDTGRREIEKDVKIFIKELEENGFISPLNRGQ